MERKPPFNAIKASRMLSLPSRYIYPMSGFYPPPMDGFESLAALALDMRWSWNHAADELFQQMDASLWELTHNPWGVLQTVSTDRLSHCLSNKKYRQKLEELIQAREDMLTKPAWFGLNYPYSPLSCVAYFSMEYMLSEALPIYVGGLGNVAGDLLKAASDLGVPIVAVGLLYQQGFFRQEIDTNGAQQLVFPYNDPVQLPITPLRQPDGEWLRVAIDFPGHTLWLRTWHVQVGRVSLYLLDSNDGANLPSHRGITSVLYGGGPELRIKQEIVLGIGGWRLLMALGLHPEVCHLNEGHTAFVALERACSFMTATDQSFEVALAATRSGNLFTTHSAVGSAFDHFAPALVEQYFGNYALKKLGIPLSQLLAMGRCNGADENESFNMAFLAMRVCNAANAVSRLHGKVSRHLFEPLFPRWPKDEVPVGHITNGVHMPSWDSASADALWTEAGGKERWRGALETLEKDIHQVPDDQLWQMRTISRTRLVEFARQKLAVQWSNTGAPPEVVNKVQHLFDPAVLTLGFARRFVGYKRPNLLLHDPERLVRILTSTDQPVQLFIAGKSNPYDTEGMAFIQQWNQFIRQYELSNHAAFLPDYDMLLTENLVQGVDVWINTPRRPWEACGTSGMKVLVNGGLNLSVLDGWWDEGYNPDVGWALGDGNNHGEDPDWDAAEADLLYNLLEQQVIPAFYTRNETGLPTAWITRMRKSMAQLTGRFSANRMVREYTEQYYIPAAKDYMNRTFEKGLAGQQMVAWKNEVIRKWPAIRFTLVKAETINDQHVFEVEVFLNGMQANDVQVEIYADCTDKAEAVRHPLIFMQRPAGATQSHVYHGTVPADRPVSDFTARIVPSYPGVAVPMEIQQIL